jgi:hypothetical protein
MAKVKPPAQRGARKAPAGGAPTDKASGTTRAATRSASDAPDDAAVADRVISSNLSLHELFQQQARQLIDRADLDEEQKQNILVAMSCPCCGAGAMSHTAKLRR